MSDITTGDAAGRLPLGTVLRQSRVVALRHAPVLVPVALVLAATDTIAGAVLRAEIMSRLGTPHPSPIAFTQAFLWQTFASFLPYILMAGIAASVACHHLSQRPPGAFGAMLTGLGRLPVLLATGLVFYIAFVLIWIPLSWLTLPMATEVSPFLPTLVWTALHIAIGTLFFTVLPAATMERRGFLQPLVRSIALGANNRIRIFILVAALVATGFLAGHAALVAAPSGISPFMFGQLTNGDLVIHTLARALTLTLYGVVPAVAYWHLRRLVDGVPAAERAAVFD